MRVLGPVGIDGVGPLEPRDRIALGVLAVRSGVTVSSEQLADALWGDDPPQSWRKQVQIRVSRLRKVLDDHAIETSSDGYRLTLDAADVDASQFERLVERGRVLVAGGEPDRAAATYHRALALWRGTPLTDLDGWPPGRSEASRLEELRRSAQEDWLVARLAAGEHREVAAAAEPLVDEEPLRERRWALLALAQYRCARQAEALRTLTRARRTLAEVGLEPGVDLLELEAAILRQDPALAPVPAPAVVSAACPYKGLAPYDRADSEAFFGRADDVQVCLDRLRASPLLVVAGPSGCGKSSLVRAGLVPALAGRGRVATVFTPGPDPAEAMARASEAGGSAPVLVVDQFEELFTHGLPIEAVRSFCQALARYALETAPVVIAVRSDQLGGLSVDAGLSSLAEHGLHLLAPLAGEALREAIEQPALLAGLRLEHGLVDLLVRDCEGEPGGLPLLSHALAETWRRRDGQTLTVAGYRDSGGIRGAVARSADRLYDGLSAGERASLRSVLLRLVSPTPDGDAVRYRVPSRALLGEPGREHVISLMVGARLLTAENETFEIAHEALARAWPRLRSWLEEDVAGQRLLRHLVSAADGWDSLGRPDTELYRGARLETALEWCDQSDRQLTAVEQAFLDASAEHAASERRALESRARRDARNNRRLVALLGALALLLAAAVAVGAIAVRESQQAHRAGDAATARGLAAAAAANVAIDPERSILLALEAVDHARTADSATLYEAEEALHRAVSAARIVWRVTGTGGTLDWSPDGSHVLTEGVESSGLIDIRDAATGEAVRSFAASDGEVTDVTYAPTGELVGTTSAAGIAAVWDSTTGELLHDMGVPGGAPAWGPSFSPDGQLFAAAWPHDGDGLVRIIRVATGEILHELRGVPGAEGTSFSPDGTRLAISSVTEPIAVVIDVASGVDLFALEEDLPVTEVAWSPDGALVATTGGVFDATSGRQEMVLAGHGSFVEAIDWSPDSTRLATGSVDGTAKIWSLVEGGGREMITLSAIDTRSGVGDIAFSPDGTRVALASRSGTTTVWDVGLTGGAEVATLPAAAFFMPDAVFTGDGRHLLVTGAGGTIGIWDARTWEQVGELGGPATPTPPSGIPGVSVAAPGDFRRIVPSPDASMTVASTFLEGPAYLWDIAAGGSPRELTVGARVSDADWTPDSNVLALAGGDRGRGLVRIVDRSGRTITQLAFPGASVGTVRFSRDGERLIVDLEPPGDNDPSDTFDPTAGRVEVWDWRDGEIVTTIDVLPWFAVPSPTSDLVAISPHIQARDQSLKIVEHGHRSAGGNARRAHRRGLRHGLQRRRNPPGNRRWRRHDPHLGPRIRRPPPDTRRPHRRDRLRRVQPRRHAARHSRHGRHRPGLGTRPRRAGRHRRAARHPRLHRRRMRALPADAVLQMTRPAVGFGRPDRRIRADSHRIVARCCRSSPFRRARLVEPLSSRSLMREACTHPTCTSGIDHRRRPTTPDRRRSRPVR